MTLSAEALDLPRDAIVLDTDRTSLPAGSGSIASTGTFSNTSAIYQAAQTIKSRLCLAMSRDRRSPLHGISPNALTIADGFIRGPGNAGESVASAMARYGKGELTAKGTTGRDFGRDPKRKKSSFGAVFTEISVDPWTMERSVERMVEAFACGRIIEPAIARNQLVGGMTWGSGRHCSRRATSIVAPVDG